jgi:hypothetical protein
MLAGAACAGFDTYTGKTFTTILNPVVQAASTSNITSAVTGVDIARLPGEGAIQFAYCVNNHPAATVSFSVATCATTNGIYVTYTNASGVSAWVYTNATGYATIPFNPNSVLQYIRVTATPNASVTNGIAGAMLITE